MFRARGRLIVECHNGGCPDTLRKYELEVALRDAILDVVRRQHALIYDVPGRAHHQLGS